MTVEETQAAYARRHKVSRKTVTAWKNAGRVAILPNGKVDVIESDRRLAGRPAEYRGGTAKGVTCEGNGAAFVTSNSGKVTDDFARGAVWMAVEVVRRVGGFGAMAALEGGGSCAVAYAAQKFLEVAFVGEFAGVLRDKRFPPFDAEADPEIWPSECVQINWPLYAENAGEPFDPEAWERHWKTRPAALKDDAH